MDKPWKSGGMPLLSDNLVAEAQFAVKYYSKRRGPYIKSVDLRSACDAANQAISRMVTYNPA